MDRAKNYWQIPLHLGIFFVSLFIICFFWPLVIQAESLRTLHLQILQMSYLGYSGLNFSSFILGAIQSFIGAYILVGLWRLAGSFFKKN